MSRTLSFRGFANTDAKSEARNLPTCGCKSMLEGLTIMLGVFITLIYTYTMPNNHYCSKPTSLRCHLMAKCDLRVGKKSKSEARKLPTCGCKSMLEGLTIMLGVFITLIYTIQCKTTAFVASLHLWGVN